MTRVARLGPIPVTSRMRRGSCSMITDSPNQLLRVDRADAASAPGQVLTDIITSAGVPVVRLTELFRKAAEIRIVINQGWVTVEVTDAQIHPHRGRLRRGLRGKPATSRRRRAAAPPVRNRGSARNNATGAPLAGRRAPIRASRRRRRRPSA
jgi:hypothetical protein